MECVVSHREEMIQCLHYTHIARPVVKAYVIFRKEHLCWQMQVCQTLHKKDIIPPKMDMSGLLFFH
jgi:hypothetical protein